VPLSTEDNLRLNVMLASQVDAVRIDEGRMIVYGLSADNEAEIKLNPNCKDEQYIKQVRELLSGHVLGSPGGYPVYLKRWTRMGQMKDESLADLLKLGEPEAIMAVVCASGLTDELARLAWWAAPDAEHARRMLENEVVVKGSMGKELADFLVEFLPFEEDPYAIVRSVRLVLQDELIDDKTRKALWDRGRKKNVFRIGFLEACAGDLPESVPARSDAGQFVEKLQALSDESNRMAAILQRVLSSEGQSFLHTAEAILRKPSNQEVVCALMNAMGNYFSDHQMPEQGEQDIHALLSHAESVCKEGEAAAVIAALPELQAEVLALQVLAGISDEVCTPVFARTDAIGTVMRKKLEPVTTPIFEQFATLRGTGS
jgi:hypothetical protein